jgi:hypothetical protein
MSARCRSRAMSKGMNRVNDRLSIANATTQAESPPGYRCSNGRRTRAAPWAPVGRARLRWAAGVDHDPHSGQVISERRREAFEHRCDDECRGRGGTAR